jgi:hypothetical protein
MSTRWKFTAPKVALLFVAGACAGYWVGRSVGSPEWRTLEVVTSAAVAVIVLFSSRRRTPRDNAPVYLNRSRF